jgi:DNA polymerase-1
MLRVQSNLKLQMPNVKMTLQVHDELVFEVPEKQARHAGELVREAMEDAFLMSVPLKVEVKTGRNWDEAK